jgi:sec-independent protein translocase protein TatC
MTEDTFISHLIELRDRLLRALIAFAVVLLVLIPFASDLYDLMATPMMSALPEGSKMIATGVITPFLVPVKVAMMVAFILTLPYTLFQSWSFIAPGLYNHEKRLVLPLVIASTLLLFLCIQHGVPFHQPDRAEKHFGGTGYRELPEFRADDVSRFRFDF